MADQYAGLGLIPVDNPIPGMIDEAAQHYGVDRNLAHVVAQMESNYNPKADSGKAQGVMQLAPPTARELGVTDAFDPSQNIDAGVRLLKRLSDKYNGDTKLVLAAYNAGEGAVKKAGGVPNYRETQNYVSQGNRKLDAAAQDVGDKYSDLGLILVNQTAPQATPEIRAPLTEPPSPNAKPPAGKQPEKTFEGFVSNLGTSALNLLSPILHPAQTVQGITELGQAMAEKSGFKPVMGQSHMQALNALGDFYKQRYGSWQGFKDAWYNDPVGMAGDLATVVSGAGLAANAAQDFIKFAGLSDAAAAAANAAGKAGTAAKGSVIGMVKAIPDIPLEAGKGAVLGGLGFQDPISGAKLGALNALRKGATEGAKEALAARVQRIADGLKAEEEARAAQRIVIGDRPVPTTPPEMAPAPPAKTAGQVFAESQGYDWSKLSTKDQTTLEQIARAQANVAAAQTPAPQSPAAAPPFQPRGLLPPAPNVIIPDAPPPPPDTSFVRAVPAQYPEVIPPTLRANTAAADLAGQLEASMRVETIADYLARNKIPNSMLESFGDNEWKMIADQAGVRAPSPENIQAIRSNLAEYEAAATQPAEVGKMAPAEAKADFEQRRAARAKRKPPAAAAEPAPAAPGAPGVPEPWRGAPPAEGAPKPTASELRIEKLAQHLAAEKGISVESLAGLVQQPEALLQFEKLAKALGEARPGPDDIPQIIERVRQLRAQ